MKISFIIGTRPEIIKVSSIIKECEKRKIDNVIIHSGQHFNYEMNKIFFEELNIRKPDYHIKLNKTVGLDNKASSNNFRENPDACISHGKQLSTMIVQIKEILSREQPDLVIVQGDTNTTLAGGLAAAKLNIKIGHIEAGLRSYDNAMPEEINRILVDRISDYLFCPTNVQEEILKYEGVGAENIFITGNTIVDAIYQNIDLAEKNGHLLDKLEFKETEYILLTIHRQENVDDERNLKEIVNGVNLVIKSFDFPVLFPVHPRTRNKLAKFNLRFSDKTVLLEPLGFLEFLQLEKYSRLILTDSGGVQEEACVLKVPCVTLRNNTERPETLEVGANILAGINAQKIKDCVELMLKSKRKWKPPFGDGTAGVKIVDKIIEMSR